MVFVNEGFEGPSMGFVTGKEDDFVIATIRAGVSGPKPKKSASIEADLVAIHPFAADSIVES